MSIGGGKSDKGAVMCGGDGFACVYANNRDSGSAWSYLRSGGNLPPWEMRIRRKRRIAATTMRLHRSGGVHAATSPKAGNAAGEISAGLMPPDGFSCVYATNMAALRPPLRGGRDVVDLCAVFLRIRDAHGGRLPPLRGGRVVIDLCDAFLCIHDVHGGRLLPRFSFGLTGNCFASIMTAGAGRHLPARRFSDRLTKIPC